jgi:hypothetical protein
MDRRTENRIIGALSAVVVAGLIVMVAGVAIALTSGHSTGVATLAAESDTPSPDGKQQIIDNVEASRAAAEQFAEEHPELLPSHSPGLHRLPESTLEPWPQGLSDPAWQLPGVDFRVDDEWQWDLDGNHVQVFAGAEFGPIRGAIIVRATSMRLQAVPDLDGWYAAPAGVGSLHIVSFQGTVLTIQATTGETFYFDAETRAFTDADGNPVTTDTPPPTPQRLT